VLLFVVVFAAWALSVDAEGVARSGSPPNEQEIGNPEAVVSAFKVTVAPARSELLTPDGELMVTLSASADAYTVKLSTVGFGNSVAKETGVCSR
jgi:hypothetical protein